MFTYSDFQSNGKYGRISPFINYGINPNYLQYLSALQSANPEVQLFNNNIDNNFNDGDKSGNSPVTIGNGGIDWNGWNSLEGIEPKVEIPDYTKDQNPTFQKPDYDVTPNVAPDAGDAIMNPKDSSNKQGTKFNLNGLSNTASNFMAMISPLIKAYDKDTYKNPQKYASLNAAAHAGNFNSFEALDNYYRNPTYVPTASLKDFGRMNKTGIYSTGVMAGSRLGQGVGNMIGKGSSTSGAAKVLGTILGFGTSAWADAVNSKKAHKALDAYNSSASATEGIISANINNSNRTASLRGLNDLLYSSAALGGKLNRFDMGGDISNGVNLIDSGSTHELNPYEGVQQGVDSQGIPNMVEEGEVVWEDEDYVFSNRLTVPKMPKKKSDDETKEEKFNRLYEGKTFAEVAERLQRESKERPNSGISKDTMNDNLSMLRDLQEEVKMKKQADEFKQEIANMSPEELMGLQQMLGAMGQQGMEQTMPEQMPQEGMMPQGMPDMGMAVNPAMMGQPMMACGGKLKKFGYGGNLFAAGGAMPDLWDKNQLEKNEVPPKQTYEEQLKYRAGMYEDEMKRLEGDYISAMTLWNKDIWNKFKNGKASNAEKQAVMDVIRRYYHNCITTTSTIDRNVNEALKNNINSLKENLSKAGVDEKDINNIATAVGNEKAFKAYASIGSFENSEAYQGEQGNPNFRTIELEYDSKDLEPGGRIYNLLQILPSGVTVGVGYNSNTSTTGDNPAHYIKLNHDKDGNPLLFEGNQSSYMNAMAEYGDFLTPEQYNEYVKEHPTYYVKDKDGNLELDKNGNPIERKYDKEYHGAKNWSIKDVADRDYYYKFKDKVHNTTIDYRTEKDNGKGGRMRILLPILDGTSIQDIDNYLSNIETHYVNTHHEPLGMQRVGWKKSESDDSYKPILSDDTYYYNTTPMSTINVSALPVENLGGLRLAERPIDIPTFDINPFRKERKSVKRDMMKDLAEKASDYVNLLPNIINPAFKEDVKDAYTLLPDYKNLTTRDIQPTLLDNTSTWNNSEGGKLNKFAYGSSFDIPPFSVDFGEWKNFGKDFIDKWKAIKDKYDLDWEGRGYGSIYADNPLGYIIPTFMHWNENPRKKDRRETRQAIRDIKGKAKETGTYEVDWSKVPNVIGSPYFPTSGVAKFDITSKSKGKESEEEKGEKFKDFLSKIGSNVSKGDALRNLAVTGNWLALLNEYLRDTSEDFKEESDFERHLTPPSISYSPVGTKAPYTPESTLAVLDRLTAMNAASRNSLMNLSNANRATKAMYNAMNDMRYFDTLGQFYRQAREQNTANLYRALELDNTLDAKNAEGALTAAIQNEMIKNQQLAYRQHLMDTLNSEALQRTQGRATMLSNALNQTGNLGREYDNKEMIAGMAKNGSALFMFNPNNYEMQYTGNGRINNPTNTSTPSEKTTKPKEIIPPEGTASYGYNPQDLYDLYPYLYNYGALGGFIDVRPLDKRVKRRK